MKLVGRYSTADEAHLARLRLGAQGIEGYLLDEYMIQMDWLYSNAMGGVRLVVHDDQADSALSILRQPPADEGMEFPPCPNCGATNTKIDVLPRKLAFGFMFFLSAPIVCIGRQFHCPACKTGWSASTPQPPKKSVHPRGADQFLGAQFLIIGLVMILFFLTSFLTKIIAPLPKLEASRGDSGFAIRESFTFPEGYLNIPLWVLVLGLCLSAMGYFLIRDSLRR